MSQFKPGDRIQYVGKQDQRYGRESLWGKVLTVVTVRSTGHNGHLSADTPSMGGRTDGYRTSWIDFDDAMIMDED